MGSFASGLDQELTECVGAVFQNGPQTDSRESTINPTISGAL